MRSVPAILLAILLAAPSEADTADWIRSERGRALSEARAGRPEAAVDILRPAIAAARRAGLRTETALCLQVLGTCREQRDEAARKRGESPPPVAIELLHAAAAAAREDGNLDVELDCLERLAFLDDPESILQPRLDAALAAGRLDVLSEILFFNPDISPPLQVLDGPAEAALARIRGDEEGALRVLTASYRTAEAGRYHRTAGRAALQVASACLRLERAPEALAAAEAALKHFGEVGDLRGRARARLHRGLAFAIASDPKARPELESAVLAALEMDDPEGECRGLEALSTLVPHAERASLVARAARAESRRQSALFQEAARAVRERSCTASLLARLREEQVRRPVSTVECVRLLAALGHPAPAPRKALSAGYAAALKEALGRKNPWPVLAGLEILRRHDAWPLIADAVEASTVQSTFADAIETLATSEDVPRLLRMASAKDPVLAEAAGAAVFRLARNEDEAAIRKVLGSKPGAAVALYLQGALARFGDAPALAILRASLAGEDATLAYHGAAILGSLGFTAQIAALEEHAETVPAFTVWRIVARAPRGWGAVLSSSPDTAADISRGRALNLQGDRERVHSLRDTRELWEALYCIPRTPEEAEICGAGWVLRISKVAAADDEPGDWSSWISSGLGYDLFGGEERLRAHAARNEAAFALADLEEFQVGRTSGAQTRTLVVQNGNAWARVLCTASPAVGDLTDNVLHVPFAFTWDTTHGHDGSLAGAIGQISLQISLSGLVPEATVRIPGHPVLKGRVRTAGESLLWVDAELPVRPDGEGLGAGTVVPVEALAAGTVTLHLKAEGSTASMTFPLALLIPSPVDKPDLVASELTLEPRVPKPGEEVSLRLRTRNIGRTPATDALLNVRFQVLNPQTGEGRRTIDVRLTEARGWRTGEWRTFEARPTAVRGWYMNAWSPTWTLEMGDTRILAVVDADGRLEEMAEDNNEVEVEVPLYAGDAEGKSLAEQEFLDLAQALLRRVGDATGEEAARQAGREALALFARAQFSTPELELAKRHLQAAVETQVHRIRVRAALSLARELSRNPGPNSGRLRDLIVELTDAETDLLDSGIPAKEDTITWWRNRTQFAANQVGATADYAELAGILNGPAGESADRLRKVGDNLNRLDGALQNIRYLRDRADGGAYDNADPIEGTCSLFAGGHPGLSKLHQALFKAEIDYIDRGFRKEAGALDALADLISGKPGAQDRLDAAVRDVETHITAGPFNEQARREILQGAVKDIPVIGKLLDSIRSWK